LRQFFKPLDGDKAPGRHLVVTAILFSFALVVTIVTVMVLTAVARVADYSNRLDDARSSETTSGALKTFQSNLVATLDDYAAWDDAARQVYAPDGMDWVVSNYGEMSANSQLFDMAIVIDDDGTTVLAYRNGAPFKGSIDAFFGPALTTLVEQVKATGPTGLPEVSGFVRTQAGLAAVGVALIREKSGALSVPSGRHRYLIFSRPLDAARIQRLGETYVIAGLRLVPPSFNAAYSVLLTDPLGSSIGRMVWTSRAPGDMSYQQVRPLVIKALGLVGMLFVILLIIGMLAARRLRKGEARSRDAALRDRLSGLLNREGMRLGFDQLVEKAKVDGTNVLLLYLDLDGFKEINDSYGHGTGDQLIRAVAAGLAVLVPEKSILARLGGDEFAVAFSARELTDGPALGLAEQVLDFLAEPLQIGPRVIVVGASIGIACSPEGRVGHEEVVRRADLAMYKAKEAGRACMVCYGTELDTDREERNVLELDLRRAIESESLTVAYQPLVDAVTHQMLGVEALVRWDRPGHGPISPDVFIPIAETSGLIEALGLFVLRRACEAARNWPGLRVSVNVSPSQFRNPAFTDYVRNVLKETDIEAGRVTLEITEGYIIQNPQRTRQSIERLKALGVRIALDDFGSGFSSIGYLRQFGFDRIKIDKSLTLAVLEGRSARDLLQATVALARSFDIPVTAEGIETEEQGIAVQQFGCDQLQGYFFGKPMRDIEISKRLETQMAQFAEIDSEVAAA
jgi:diguanylate cyclase (GGDEF)-like protein